VPTMTTVAMATRTPTEFFCTKNLPHINFETTFQYALKIGEMATDSEHLE
jgi:hypothetical protein